MIGFMSIVSFSATVVWSLECTPEDVRCLQSGSRTFSYCDGVFLGDEQVGLTQCFDVGQCGLTQPCKTCVSTLVDLRRDCLDYPKQMDTSECLGKIIISELPKCIGRANIAFQIEYTYNDGESTHTERRYTFADKASDFVTPVSLLSLLIFTLV